MGSGSGRRRAGSQQLVPTIRRYQCLNLCFAPMATLNVALDWDPINLYSNENLKCYHGCC